MIELEITGMSCEHCVRTVSDALGQVSGVTKVGVERGPTSGTAVVEGQAAAQALVAAVTAAGYQAEVRRSA